MEREYSVVLVDDDLLALDDLKGLIDWEREGFRLAGIYENGRAALEKLEAAPADIVIADIEMPVMDGLALAQRIHERWPQTQLLLLTAFSRFDYAKRAVSLGIYDYALKHELDAAALLRYLRGMGEACEAGQEALSFNRQRQIKQLLAGGGEDAAALSAQLRFGTEYGAACLILLQPMPSLAERLSPQGWFPEGDGLKGACLDGLRGEYAFDLWEGAEQGCWLLLETAGEGGEEPFLRRAVPLFERAWARPVGAVYRPGLRRAGALRAAFRDVARQKDRLFYTRPGGRVLPARDGWEGPSPERLHDQGEGLLLRLSGLDAAQAELSAADCLDQLEARGAAAAELAAAARVLLADLGRRLRLLPPGRQSEADLRTPLRSIWDFAGLRGFVLEAYGGLRQEGPRQYSEKAACILEMVRENCGQEDVLERVAESLQLSREYMGKLFKKETGETLGQYLLDCRMKKARWLLENTHDKIYEVAEAVGYRSGQYFSMAFYKYYHASPSSFQKEG